MCLCTQGYVQARCTKYLVGGLHCSVVTFVVDAPALFAATLTVTTKGICGETFPILDIYSGSELGGGNPFGSQPFRMVDAFFGSIRIRPGEKAATALPGNQREGLNMTHSSFSNFYCLLSRWPPFLAGAAFSGIFGIKRPKRKAIRVER